MLYQATYFSKFLKCNIGKFDRLHTMYRRHQIIKYFWGIPPLIATLDAYAFLRRFFWVPIETHLSVRIKSHPNIVRQKFTFLCPKISVMAANFPHLCFLFQTHLLPRKKDREKMSKINWPRLKTFHSPPFPPYPYNFRIKREEYVQKKAFCPPPSHFPTFCLSYPSINPRNFV